MSKKAGNNKVSLLGKLKQIFKKQNTKKTSRSKIISKGNFIPFLQTISASIDELAIYYADKDREEFLERLKTESNVWFNKMRYMDEYSFKAGVCFGIFTIHNKINYKEIDKPIRQGGYIT